MNNLIEQMQQYIDSLDGPVASELHEVLAGIRDKLEQKTLESEQLAKAQADAIVNSAAIISELQETQSRLKEANVEAEAASEAARRLTAFGDVIEQSLNEIYIFDAESLKFVHVNRGGQENIGYTMDELRQLTPLSLKPRFTRTAFLEMLRPLLDGTASKIDFTTVHRRKDGSEYTVKVNLEASTLDGRRVFAAVIVDITERVQLEKELREAKDRAMAADRFKSEFLTNMSHEIRTPMTAILGFSEVLLDNETTEQERRGAVETIRRNGEHLLDLINGILDLSKIEAGKLEIEWRRTNPMNILYDVRDLLAHRAKAQGNDLQIAWSGGIPQQIRTDPTRLKQALVNLVGNAIKFTRDGDIRIVVECNRPDELMCFHVIDSGIGISREQIERVFQPFNQADASTTRKYGGTGLGLTITKRIAELLGGGISVESELGRGSKFALTVATGPLAGVQMCSAWNDGRSPAGATCPSAAGGGMGMAGRVLLVEDGPDNQRLIALLLRKAGAEVTLAVNGKEGLDLALAAMNDGAPFDVILMDMQMPVMDGYTATNQLRERGYPGQILALTAHAMKGDIDRCLAAGCDAYLSKPIDRKTFIAEVGARMGKNSQFQPAGQPVDL